MKVIHVTEPFLPPLEEYVEFLKGIWDRNWLTNQGALVQELEEKLQSYHGLEQPVHCMANGGLGLQIILRALGIKGEVITTPFSYVATTSCPLWEGCTVKFGDVDPVHLTLDPEAAEAAITPRTEAILATHVYGNPCDVEAFEKIGEKYGIPIIYDAAHAFGVKYKGRSLLEWGDASMVSLHATKLFHTVEGGFVSAKDEAIRKKLDWMRRFGHNGPENFHGVAINAKMSEFHAAMGLSIFPYIEGIIKKRKATCAIYDDAFESHTRIRFAIKIRDQTEWNGSYYPIRFESVEHLLKVETALLDQKIESRRYFHPLLSDVNSLKTDKVDLPQAQEASTKILCLPLATTMSSEMTEKIVSIIFE